MDFGTMKNMCFHKFNSILSSLSQYKYAALILLIGIILLVFPQNEKQINDKTNIQQTEVALEQKLKQILEHVDGVGNVYVLLSVREKASYEYQMNERYEIRDEQEEVEKETVLLKGENGEEVALTVRSGNPTYEGALIVCQGGDNPLVQYNVVNAVSDLTGLSSDKISVIKMKSN